METVLTDDRKVKKVGMKDIQREGWEYELTVSLSIDRDTHMAIASKDRTELFEGKPPFIITEETGKIIKDWCEKGIEPPKPLITQSQFEQATERISKGETELIAKVKATYTLDTLQYKQICELENKIKQTA